MFYNIFCTLILPFFCSNFVALTKVKIEMKRYLSILCFVCSAIVMHANFYVSVSGNDEQDGSSWATAKQSIQVAIDAANDGDTVCISEGVYNQTIVLKKAIHLFGGYSSETGERNHEIYSTILDGTGLDKQLIKQNSSFSHGVYFDGLILQNANHSSNGGAAALKGNGILNHCTIRSCYTSGSGGAVHNDGGTIANCVIELCESMGAGGAVHNIGGIVENTIIRGCKGNYAAIRNESNGIVRNCLLHNNEPSGSAWPNSGGIYNPSGVVYHNTLVCNYGSQYAGIHSDNIAYNNLVWNNQSEEGFADPANFISSENTKNGSGNNAGDSYFDKGNFTITLSKENTGKNGPHFLAPTNFVGAPKNAAEIAAMRAANFTITAESAVIDKARANTDLTYDIDNNPRPINDRADIGCYEYDPNAPVIDVTGVKLNMDTLYVYTTDTALITAMIIPAKATNRHVTWQIADTAIALVTEQGGVIGVKEGATSVTVTTEQGNYTASAIVIVEPKPIVIIHPDVLLADSLYTIEDYTIPSYIPFWIAKEAARADSTEVNLQDLREKIAQLVPYQMPYNVVTNIHGDPKTRMAFCWFTNERMTDGVVELMPLTNSELPTNQIFKATTTIAATPTVTLPLNYATSSSGILKATKMKPTQEYTYISHKAIAEGLTPNTTYAYRVGIEGAWSEVGMFSTAPDKEEPFTFIYMTDSHIMDQSYINQARLCATAAAQYTPEAKFCVFPGDFVETGTNRNSEWEWERWFDEAIRPVIQQMPIVPTDGNHDDSENLNYTYHFNTDNTFKENAQVKPQFDGTTYSFVYGDVLFLVYSLQDYWKGSYSLSTLTSTYLTNDVGNWFREQVEAHPEAKWRIALVHKNIFSGSGHQEDEETPLFRATMLPIMKECEIDVMLQGHDHCYEIIGPVDPDTRTPILSAIEGVEDVPVNMVNNMTGKKGGTFTTNDGTLYFIGATCGTKRYQPNHKLTMEADYEKHKVENYYDLFTGMFGQPGRPSYSTFTVDGNTITVNSYKVYEGMDPMLFNTFHIKRTKEHGAPISLSKIIEQRGAAKIVYNGNMYILREDIAYNALGQVVAEEDILSRL